MNSDTNSEIKKYFSTNRISWDQFYPSERIVIEKIWPQRLQDVLDIGCGCAGLYTAIEEKFGPGSVNYTGIELDSDASKYAAKRLIGKAKIINTDFETYEHQSSERYNIVFSLSCFDWNTNLGADALQSFYAMFQKSWNMVADGGYLVISLRLDAEMTVMDIDKSYQYINYSGKREGDIANYSVISVHDCYSLFRQQNVCSIIGFGYYGVPSVTAVTPFENICFSVFALKKQVGYNDAPNLEIDFPLEIDKIFKKLTDESC